MMGASWLKLSFRSLPGANPPWYLAPGGLRHRRVKGGVGTFCRIPAGRLYVDMPLGGEENAGFGVQPRDFDGTLALWAQVQRL